MVTRSTTNASNSASAGSSSSLPCQWRFGPFMLCTATPALYRDQQTVALGSRALALLTVLVQNAGQLLSNETLMAAVWPHTVVEEANLRVHIAALRRALGEQWACYLRNDPGRGYAFVASVNAVPDLPQTLHGQSNLPLFTTPLVGRKRLYNELSQKLQEQQLVTLVGAGGIGKTRLAVALAENLAPVFRDGVVFFNLASVDHPSQVAAGLAALLELSNITPNKMPSITLALAHRELLLVLDNCEHLIDEVAQCCEAILRAAPAVTLLATSREPLRIDGEWVARLPPLRVPDLESLRHNCETVSGTALALFFQRCDPQPVDLAALSDEKLQRLLAQLRQVDGIPLAIELLAAQVNVYDLDCEPRASSLIENCTALPRDATMKATLDRSYILLSDIERSALQQLALFRAAFTLKAAEAVLDLTEFCGVSVVDTLASLTDKSLLCVDLSGDEARYRLLELTRKYAHEQLTQQSQRARASWRRFCDYCSAALQRVEEDWGALGREQWHRVHGRFIDQIRACLDWAFADGGDIARGVRLTLASFSMANRLALIDEWRDRLELALRRAAGLDIDPVQELELYGQLTQAAVMSRGSAGCDPEILMRMLNMADRTGVGELQAGAAYANWIWAFGAGHYLQAQKLANRFALFTRYSAVYADVLTALRLQAQCWHYLGKHARAHVALCDLWARREQHRARSYLGMKQPHFGVSVGITLARSFWLSGRAQTAEKILGEALALAEGDHHVSTCMVLVLAAIPIAIWNGDMAVADQRLGLLKQHTLSDSDHQWQQWIMVFDSAIDPGRICARTKSFASLSTKPADFLCTVEGSYVHPHTLQRVESGAMGWCAPEAWRREGLRAMAGGDIELAQAFFTRAVALARTQGALAWELRAALNMVDCGAFDCAENDLWSQLNNVYQRFPEKQATRDLTHARTLLGRRESLQDARGEDGAALHGDWLKVDNDGQ